ncbi:MAG: CsbD family protein [Hyphomonadaceae bacterium]
MNWDQIEGKWDQFRGKAQTQWGKLTDQDFEVIKGKRTELAGRIKERYGVEKEEAERQIDTWMRSL